MQIKVFRLVCKRKRDKAGSVRTRARSPLAAAFRFLSNDLALHGIAIEKAHLKATWIAYPSFEPVQAPGFLHELHIRSEKEDL